MRTTVTIDDYVLKRAREIALDTSRSLSAVVDEALRSLVRRADNGEAVRAAGGIKLPVYGGSGLQPGVDLDDKEALAELLDRPDDEGDQAQASRAAG